MLASSDNEWKAKYEAPSGFLWVCSACGRNGTNRADIGDESCFMNAVLCHEKRDLATGKWVAAKLNAAEANQ